MTTAEREAAAYLDAGRPLGERVDDLIGRMTIDEKLGQLGSLWSFELTEGGEYSRDRAQQLAPHGLGQVTRVGGASSFDSRQSATFTNAVQRYLVDETRLGIPAIVHEEICSGLMARGSTMFPQAIGVASTWDADLSGALADAVRVQMRAVGAHQGLSPVLDVCRDPRWGRTEETFGEDPYLVSRMGIAFVRGLQGADLRDGVVATAKHFVGYAASEGGLNWAPMHVGERELHDVYLHPFEAVVREAGLRSVMNAYNEVDGVPCTASRELLTELLRGEWGFDGCVVSDYFAVRQLDSYHHLVADGPEAAATALVAGIDVELPSTDCYGDPLREALERGLLSEADIDVAVGRVLATKFALGLFEQPYVDEQAAAVAVGDRRAPASRAHDRRQEPRAARERRRPTARARRQRGCHRPERRQHAEPAERLQLRRTRRVAERDGAVRRQCLLDQPARSARVRRSGSRRPDDPRRAAGAPRREGLLRAWLRHPGVDDRSGFAEAVAAATAADVAVLVVGDKAGLSDDSTTRREPRPLEPRPARACRKSSSHAVLATGTPVVLVLVAGRPCGSVEAARAERGRVARVASGRARGQRRSQTR